MAPLTPREAELTEALARLVRALEGVPLDHHQSNQLEAARMTLAKGRSAA